MDQPPASDPTGAGELERLLWERIDGTLDATGAEQLRRLAARDPEAGRLEAEISALAARLDAVEEAPVPADLADDIRHALRSVTGADAATTDPGRSWTASLAEIGGPRPARRLIYLAAVLVIAVVGYQLVTGEGGRDRGTFTGTAGLTEPAPDAPAVRLALPRSQGVLTLSRSGGVALVELETAPSLGPARLEVRGADLVIERTDKQGEATFELSSDDRGLEVEVTGAGVFSLAVAGGPELEVLVSADGETLVSHRF